MNLLRGCRAFYTPAFNRAIPTPLVGDGPVLRFWRDGNANSDITPAPPTPANSVIGPTWDMTPNGTGVWGYVPDKWRGFERTSGTAGELWRMNGGGATVAWYGVLTDVTGGWRGLGGIMIDAQDTTPWGILSLRLSSGNNIVAQTSYNRTSYVEAMHATPYSTAGLLNIPLVIVGVIRPRPGANTRLELWVGGGLQTATVDRDDAHNFAQFFASSARGIVFIGNPTGIMANTMPGTNFARYMSLWDRALSPNEITQLSASPLSVERAAFRARFGATVGVNLRTLRPSGLDIINTGWSAS